MDVVCVKGWGAPPGCAGVLAAPAAHGGDDNNGSGSFSLPSLQSPHGRFFSVLFVWSNGSKGSWCGSFQEILLGLSFGKFRVSVQRLLFRTSVFCFPVPSLSHFSQAAHFINGGWYAIWGPFLQDLGFFDVAIWLPHAPCRRWELLPLPVPDGAPARVYCKHSQNGHKRPWVGYGDEPTKNN